MPIRIRYSAIDGFTQTRQFKTLAGARRYASERVGAHPTAGAGYAVSDDGVGKVTVSGATLADLFAAPVRAPTESAMLEAWAREQRDLDRKLAEDEARRYRAEMEALRPRRALDCICTDQQLIQVGCDCFATWPF